MFDRTLARVLSSQIVTFCFVFYIYIVINDYFILEEQPCKMDELKWNKINN